MNYYQKKCQFHLGNTKFCLGLGKSQQNQFALLLQQVAYIDFDKIRLPLDFGDIKNFYITYTYIQFTKAYLVQKYLYMANIYVYHYLL